MNYDFKGITVEELSFKLNRIHFEPNSRLDIKPQFARQVRKANEDNRLIFIAFSVKIESTEAEPKPFDLTASIVGIYELEKADYTPLEERAFVIEATQKLYPYLRAAVTNLTAQSYISPLNLPVINGPIFPEDKDGEEKGGVYTFTPGKLN